MRTKGQIRLNAALIMMFLIVSTLLAACGSDAVTTSVVTTTVNAAATTTPIPETTTAATTTASTTVATTTTAATTQTTASTTTAKSTQDVGGSISGVFGTVTTTIAPTTAPATTVVPTTVPAVPTTASAATVAPTTTSAATSEPVISTSAADASQDNLPVGGFATKGVCTAAGLAKMAGKDYSVVADSKDKVNNENVEIVVVGKLNGYADYSEEMQAFVIGSKCASSGAYTLIPDSAHGATGFGEWKPEVKVTDIHSDGKDEIVIDGGQGAHWSILNVFAFDSAKGVYRTQAAFNGDLAAELAKEEGDWVIEGFRYYDFSQLGQLFNYQWSKQEQKYKFMYSQVVYALGKPDKPATPADVVMFYYEDITNKDYQAAYNLLGSSFQQQQSLAQFEQGFKNTNEVIVEDIVLPKEGNDMLTAGGYKDGTYQVGVTILSTDTVNNASRQTQYKGIWTVVVKNGTPILQKANIAKIGQ